MRHTQRNNMRLRAGSRLEQAGFTLAEAVVTVAVSMMGLGGVMMMNAQQLKLVSSTRESNAASWALQDRLEHLRNVSWERLTSSTELPKALSTLPDCAQLLPNYTERVTLVKSTDADKSDAEKLVVVRGADGTMQTVSTGSGFATGHEVKVDVLVSWTSRGGRTRQRSYTSIISDSGVSRTNIPGFGGPTGTTPVENGAPSTGNDTSTDPVPTEQPVEIITNDPGSSSGGSTNSGNGGSGNGNDGTNNGNGGTNNGNGGNSETNNGNGNPHGNTNSQHGQG